MTKHYFVITVFFSCFSKVGKRKAAADLFKCFVILLFSCLNRKKIEIGLIIEIVKSNCFFKIGKCQLSLSKFPLEKCFVNMVIRYVRLDLYTALDKLITLLQSSFKQAFRALRTQLIDCTHKIMIREAEENQKTFSWRKYAGFSENKHLMLLECLLISKN